MKEKAPASRLKKILLGALGVLVAILVVIAITLSTIVTKVANDQLPTQLGTEATLGSAHINALIGRVALNDLTIEQPEGFEELGEAFLTLDHLVINAPIHKALDQDPITIRNLKLSGLKVNLISDTNVVLNVRKLGPAAKVEPIEEVLPEETFAEPAAVPPVWIKHVLLENIHIAFQDYERDWGIDVEDVRFEIKDLQISEARADGPGTMDGHLHFHSEKASGRLKLHAKIGVITPDKPETVPPVQIALGLIGFDLDLVEPFLVPSPSVAKAAFGGSGFDFKLFMQIAPGSTPAQQAIIGSFELITDKGQNTDGKLGGSVAEPVLPFTGLFADILGNQFGRALGVGGNVAQGGLEAGKAVGKTGVAAVKGVGKTVGGFAGGVLKTAKGVVTLDGESVKGGLSDATVGTVKNAAGTVGDTAKTAGQGVKDTAGTVTGSDDVNAWWENVENRQTEFDEEAFAWFEENPFETLLQAPATKPTEVKPGKEKSEPTSASTPTPEPISSPEPTSVPEPTPEPEPTMVPESAPEPESQPETEPEASPEPKETDSEE